MNYEQAKQVIKLWENVHKPHLKEDVNTFKAYMKKSQANIDEANKEVENFERKQISRLDLTENVKESFTELVMKDVKEMVNELMVGKIEDITYYNHLVCVFSHAYNGDLGRATRSAMKFKEYIHEYLANLEARTDDLKVDKLDMDLKKVGEIEKEGAYNFLAKNMKETNETVDKVLKMLEEYLTAREVKQAKKNMRKRKKKKK